MENSSNQNGELEIH